MKFPILALSILAVAAWAQPPAPAVTELKTYLALTDAQVTSLQTIQQNLHTSTDTTMQQIQTKQQSLNTQLAAGGATAATLGQLLLDIQTLRSSIKQAETASQSQSLNVLTADQKTKLKVLTDASALRLQVDEATMLGLIARPADAQGGAPGMRGPAGRGGPQSMGMGMAPGMGPMMRRPAGGGQ